MAQIGFIGLGNMGKPMARNLATAGHTVRGFDLVDGAAEAVGIPAAASAQDAATGSEVLITMLPTGAEVRDVYLGGRGVFEAIDAATLVIDCSTIDVTTAREVSARAEERGIAMVDAPVSGGVAGAETASLTFMVGGAEAAYARAEPTLRAMGKTIVHTGAAGNGQAVKICNNMMLAISMIGVAEAFVLAEQLGLDRQTLFDVVSKSTGQSWALTSYCPAPGPVPTSPANRKFKAGFTAAMMLKDLRLAQQAVHGAGTASPLGAEACALYGLFDGAGHGALDFSGIIEMIRGDRA
jgi:3-hydroxyisobutyrate dehydrogenase